MTRYSPLWVYECIIAQCTIDFINLGYGLDVISKKYADGLNKIYKDIFKVELQADCKSYISLLKECNVQSESIELLENFIYFRFNFRNRFVKRKLKKGIIFNPFTSIRKKKLVSDNICYYLYKYIMDMEAGTNIKIRKDSEWTLGDQEHYIELSDIVNKPLPMHDEKRIMLQMRRDENQKSWFKN